MIEMMMYEDVEMNAGSPECWILEVATGTIHWRSRFPTSNRMNTKRSESHKEDETKTTC